MKISGKKHFLKIRYSSGLALWTAIIAMFLEALSGFLIALSIPEGIVEEQYRAMFFTIAVVLLIVVALISAFNLFTPLFEFLPQPLKLFEAFMFAIISLGVIAVRAIQNIDNQLFVHSAFIGLLLFVLSFVMFYLNYMMGTKKVMKIMEHKKVLEKFNRYLLKLSEKLKSERTVEELQDIGNALGLTFQEILRVEIIERGDVSRLIYLSTVFAGAFYLGVSLIQAYGTVFSAQLIIMLFVFSVIIVLMAMIFDAVLLRARELASK